MDVFLAIRPHATSIFADAKASSRVFQLKRILERSLRRPPEEHKIYKDYALLDDHKILGESSFAS